MTGAFLILAQHSATPPSVVMEVLPPLEVATLKAMPLPSGPATRDVSKMRSHIGGAVALTCGSVLIRATRLSRMESSVSPGADV